ncbi:MAG: hypothetical protein B6I36_06505 [Desulfobacteraceae bacterium 4572_35.1]|nr:MAG: hypothetical protein B6I36_06505 [Desulfobacteraceae bacterium 4572_35.1]
MRVSTILDYIDNGHMALPEFQRGYVWNRDQVRGLMLSLYKQHPVGSLLVWSTESKDADFRGDGTLAPGIVKLLLDGQQRITSLYGLIRGKAPEFFDGDVNAFTGLFFNIDSEEFSFYMPKKMAGDPMWVDVTKVMQDGIGPHVTALGTDPVHAPNLAHFVNRLNKIESIKNIEFHIEDVTGKDKTVDVVVDIFNQVNSGGTKLSKGDLALAKICAEWPEARGTMRKALDDWKKAEYNFELDWLLRNVNTIATGEARFSALHTIESEAFKQSLDQAVKICNYLLDLISARFGLDHDRVLFGRYAFPVLTHYIGRVGGSISDEADIRKLLFWYLHSALWGKFSGSTESIINKDLEVLEDVDGGLDRLIEDLVLWRGDLTVKPDHFGGWSRGARFYPFLYLLTRTGDSKDWGLGIPLKKGLLGKNTSLEVHHIFPKAQLKKFGYDKAQINAVANFCFLTKNTNLKISDRKPEDYFKEIEDKFPGALSSQWIPMDRSLWTIDKYPQFLHERRKLLAAAANTLLDSLHIVAPAATSTNIQQVNDAPATVAISVNSGITTDEEEQAIQKLRSWMKEQGLPAGYMEYELTDGDYDEVTVVLDVAWPEGVQQGLSQPVAVLLDEGAEVYRIAGEKGFRYFTVIDDFKKYVMREVLGEHYFGLPEWANDVDGKMIPLLDYLLARQVSRPVCGYEFQSENGEVIGELELAWPEKKIGVWTQRGNELNINTRLQGWLVYDMQEVLENPDLLNFALEK